MADGQVAETLDRPAAMKYKKVLVLDMVPARTIEFQPRPRPLKVLGRNISTNGAPKTSYLITFGPPSREVNGGALNGNMQDLRGATSLPEGDCKQCRA